MTEVGRVRRRARHLADSLFRHTSETLCYSLVSGPTRESEVCRVVTVRVSGYIPYCAHPGVLDVRGRSDFSRFDPASPGDGPTLAKDLP